MRVSFFVKIFKKADVSRVFFVCINFLETVDFSVKSDYN